MWRRCLRRGSASQPCLGILAGSTLLSPIYPLNFPGHAGWQSTFDQTMFRSQGLRQGETWNMPNSSLLID